VFTCPSLTYNWCTQKIARCQLFSQKKQKQKQKLALVDVVDRTNHTNTSCTTAGFHDPCSSAHAGFRPRTPLCSSALRRFAHCELNFVIKSVICLPCQTCVLSNCPELELDRQTAIKGYKRNSILLSDGHARQVEGVSGTPSCLERRGKRATR
jgi:hypothetical protein